MRPLLPLVLAPVLLLGTRPAEACSPPQCWGGAFLPGDGSTIPANAPALYWRPTRGHNGPPADASSVKLTTVVDPGAALPFTATVLANGDYLIVPDGPLVEGTSYVLEDLSTCADLAGPRVTFLAGPSAPLPTSLGSITTDPHGTRLDLQVATATGSCSTTVDAMTFGIAVAPAPSAEPWMPLFLFETVVDDGPWAVRASINASPVPGASWKGRGRDLLFRTCTPNPDASYQGLAAGDHEVEFRGALPGGAPIATTPLVVALTCDPDTSEPDPGASSGCASTTPTSSGLFLLALAGLYRRRRR